MSEQQMQTTEKATAAFVLSLLAGLWMLSAGGMMGGFGMGGMMQGYGGQGGHYGSYGMSHFQGMSGWMWGSGMHAFGMSWPWLGVAAGIVVLIGAVMLYVRPQQRRSWGLVILADFSSRFFCGNGRPISGSARRDRRGSGYGWKVVNPVWRRSRQ